MFGRKGGRSKPQIRKRVEGPRVRGRGKRTHGGWDRCIGRIEYVSGGVDEEGKNVLREGWRNRSR